MRERWRNVSGYDGRYQVSSLGNIRKVKITNGKRTTRALSPYSNNRGYDMVDLCMYGSRRRMLVHRLVAEAFIPNPLHLPEVNHKDWNTHNNCVENLEWCDRPYNAKYKRRFIRKDDSNGMAE